MVEINYLLDFIDPIIMGICLALGYALKNAFEKFPNRFIPLTAMVVGLILAVVLNFQSITAEVVLGGMISGLASTGLYELLRNLINKE